MKPSHFMFQMRRGASNLFFLESQINFLLNIKMKPPHFFVSDEKLTAEDKLSESNSHQAKEADQGTRTQCKFTEFTTKKKFFSSRLMPWGSIKVYQIPFVQSPICLFTIHYVHVEDVIYSI